ncbi:hypothetical protein PIB30_066763 [Stylosanthes scabra]|uniref:Uncharacterized protein n=1 Tax=Stylosanthes scabra TaxID=79078 RepID=A0ABU6XN62_9FABA|nr:hypothetical protein [Stylosanthes scabra]
MQAREQQARTPSTADINGEVNLGATLTGLSMDSLVRWPTILHPKSELGSTGAGLNQGVPYLPPKPKRLPETGIDQLQRSLGVRIQNQFLLESKLHLVSAEAQAHDHLRYSAYHGGTDPR